MYKQKNILHYFLYVVVLFLLVSCGEQTVGDQSVVESESSVIESEESPQVVEESTAEDTAASIENERLETMSLEEKVGQMFLARYPDEDSLAYAIHYDLGGYIWFAKDFSEKDPQIVQSEINAIQADMPIDLFMAVDEEGGDVVRISSFPQYRKTPFLTPRQAFEEGGWSSVEDLAHEQAMLLKSLRFNLNLAPVVDMPNSSDDFMYHRAFSTELADVTKFTELFVSSYTNDKVGTVLKHFPGYGSNVDTHTGVAYDGRSLETLKERDLIPFQTGIDNGSKAILVAHNVMTAIDPDWPATLSPKVIAILRDDMGFEGMIMTDDLIMDGLQAFATVEEAAVLAVLAGNDVLISSDFLVQIPAVIAAVEDGRIPEEVIDAAVLRILKVKIELGLI